MNGKPVIVTTQYWPPERPLSTTTASQIFVFNKTSPLLGAPSCERLVNADRSVCIHDAHAQGAHSGGRFAEDDDSFLTTKKTSKKINTPKPCTHTHFFTYKTRVVVLLKIQQVRTCASSVNRSHNAQRSPENTTPR